MGAFIASITEPPEGVTWGLLALALALALLAGALRRRNGDQ